MDEPRTLCKSMQWLNLQLQGLIVFELVAAESSRVVGISTLLLPHCHYGNDNSNSGQTQGEDDNDHHDNDDGLGIVIR